MVIVIFLLKEIAGNTCLPVGRNADTTFFVAPSFSACLR